jgi:hypothetical protein
MERAPDSFIAALIELDQELLAAVPGQEIQTMEHMARRQALVVHLLAGHPTADHLAEMQARTASLEEKFLHWRRASIMELSDIDQHLRYLSEQRSGTAVAIVSRINVSG